MSVTTADTQAAEVEEVPFEPQVVQVLGVEPEAAERLKELVESDADKILRRDAVLADAADPDSPLHTYFEWDKDEAAEKYRQIQAENLIRRVRVQIITEPLKPPILVRAFISRTDVPSAHKGVGAYIPITQIRGQSAYEADLRTSMERDIRRLVKKYHDTALLFSVVEEVLEEHKGTAE